MRASPAPRRSRTRERLSFLGRLDIEGNARRLENLRPPSDQLVPAHTGLGAILEVRRCAEGDVVSPVFRHGHGIVP
jgi:hypothetical protein